MTIQSMNNVGIVVDDMDATVALFTELGLEVEGKGQGQVEGSWADECVGLEGVRCDIVMMRTPDGHSRLELAKYRSPAAQPATPQNPPHNTIGMHRVMFAMDNLEGTVARLRPHGAELVGSVARFENAYLLCYLRTPEGIIVGLAQHLQ
ncbi:VOC family protein [Kribbella sp. NPDC055071]